MKKIEVVFVCFVFALFLLSFVFVSNRPVQIELKRDKFVQKWNQLGSNNNINIRAYIWLFFGGNRNRSNV